MLGNGAAGASYGDLLVTALVVLGAVCIAAFVVVRVVGRLLATGRARGAHLLDVVARLPLEPRRSLYVVQVPGKTLLVGTSEMGLSVLTELDGGEVRARAEARPSFGELVRAAWLRRPRVAVHGEQQGDARALDADAPGLPLRGAAVPVPETAPDASPAVPSSADAVRGSPASAELEAGSPTSAVSAVGSPTSAASAVGSPASARSAVGSPASAGSAVGSPASAASAVGSPASARSAVGPPAIERARGGTTSVDEAP